MKSEHSREHLVTVSDQIASSGVSVVLLTFNEEVNLPHALASVQGWSDDVHVVDCLSSDRTVGIAGGFGVNVHQHPWTDWATQRNWAQDNCDLRHPWVLYLDADERLTPEARHEISQRVSMADSHTIGFYLHFHYYFLGRLVRGGMQPHLRLVRVPPVRWVSEGARERCTAPASSPSIRARLIHWEHRDLKFLAMKNCEKARMDAAYWSERGTPGESPENNSRESGAKGNWRSRARAMIFRGPPFIRVIPFFVYRLARTGFRSGWPGIVHAVFLGLWFPLLVDLMRLERKWSNAGAEEGLFDQGKRGE